MNMSLSFLQHDVSFFATMMSVLPTQARAVHLELLQPVGKARPPAACDTVKNRCTHVHKSLMLDSSALCTDHCQGHGIVQV